MWAIVGLLLWPLIEVGLFVTLGARLGLWASLAIVLGSAALGVVLLRRAAAVTGGGGRRAVSLERLTREGFTGLAAVLLILPGFLTDALGLLLLVPPVQHLALWLVARRLGRFGPPQHNRPGQRSGQEDVIDGEWHEVTKEDRRQPPSGWTRH